MAQHTFNGLKVEYDPAAFGKWSVQRAMADAASKDPEQAHKIYDAYDAVLMGKADEVAEALGDDAEAMGELFRELTEQAAKENEDAKN